jgi:transcriptional regulator with XRE-family HTH domain
MTIGKLIKEQREYLNTDGQFSIRKVAKRCGFSATYLSKIERGVENCPTMKVISALAEDLEMNADELCQAAGRLPDDQIAWLASKQTILAGLLCIGPYLADKDLEKINSYALNLLRKGE